MTLFVISWTGGYEAPSYAVFATKEEAFAKAEEWAKDMREGEDSIDVLEIDTEKMTIERLERGEDE